jgi:tetratricopeptide (TPR) repeat protein
VKRQYVIAGLICMLALAAYLPAMTAGYVWDDDTFLYENPWIHAGDGLARFWFTTEPYDYYPLTSSMLWVEWRLWGGQPWGFHLVNILLHAGSAVLVWKVLERLKVPGAALAGALFAVHPVTVQSVAWITERKNTLPMVLYLGSLLAYLQWEDGRPKKLYLWSVGLFLLAMLAKTAPVAMPLVLLVLAWKRRGRIGLADLRRVLPFLAISIGLGLLTVWYQSHRAIANEVVRSDSLLSRAVIASWAVWFYLYKAVWPVGLAFTYPRWRADLAAPASYLPLAGMVVLTAGLWLLRRRLGRGPLAAWLYFLLMLGPVLGFIEIYYMRYTFVADHWQYFALPAVLAVLAAAGAWAVGRLAGGNVKLAWAGSALLLLPLAVLSFRQCGVYHDNESLWQDTVAKNPSCWLGWDQLGVNQARAGDILKAKALFEKSLEVFPDQGEGHRLLAKALANQPMPDYRRAMEHYQRSLELRPFDPITQTEYCQLLLACPVQSLRNPAKALELARQACKDHPNNPAAKSLLQQAEATSRRSRPSYLPQE